MSGIPVWFPAASGRQKWRQHLFTWRFPATLSPTRLKYRTTPTMSRNTRLFMDRSFDQPHCEHTRKPFVICTTPRTASTLLCELLYKNGVGVPCEYFSHSEHAVLYADLFGLGLDFKKTNARDLSTYVAALKQFRTTPNGYFGFKMHWLHFRWFCKYLDPAIEFPSLNYIHLTREDELEQAISLCKAIQTKQWNSNQSIQFRPVYDADQIHWFLQSIKRWNKRWREYFSTLDRPVHHLSFEQFTSNPEQSLRGCLKFLECPVDGVFSDLGSVRYQPVRSTINEEWRQRYRHDVASLQGKSKVPD